MTLDFKNNNATRLGESVKLITTKPGHYTIPISPYKNVPNNLTTETIIAAMEPWNLEVEVAD